MFSRRLFLASAAALAAQTAPPPKSFPWPKGKRFAISISFDDARDTQISAGLDLLAEENAKATFYVLPQSVERKLDGWKRAVADGHEIGNHTMTHPCSINFEFVQKKGNGLEDMDATKMGEDMDQAQREIKRLLDVEPVSFAYPCGQTYVGRGENTRSYVPLAAKRFLTARGYNSEAANDPRYCDLANLLAINSDGLTWAQMRTALEPVIRQGGWLIFAGHEMGGSRPQTTDLEALRQLCRFAAELENGAWLGTVGEIGAYLKKNR